MFSFKRALKSSGLVAVLGAMAFAIPAQATEVKAQCSLLLGVAAVQDNDEDKMGVRMVGGDGHYTFASPLVRCIGLEKGALAISTFLVRSRGKYISIVCGTGKARSTQGQSSIVPGSFRYILGGDPNKGEAFYSAVVSRLKYDIEFIADQGEFFWHNDPGGGVKTDSTTKPPTIPKLMDAVIPNNDPRWKTPNPPKEFVYAGHIVLFGTPLNEPKNGDPLKATCVRVFDVHGSIVIDV